MVKHSRIVTVQDESMGATFLFTITSKTKYPAIRSAAAAAFGVPAKYVVLYRQLNNWTPPWWRRIKSKKTPMCRQGFPLTYDPRQQPWQIPAFPAIIRVRLQGIHADGTYALGMTAAQALAADGAGMRPYMP